MKATKLQLVRSKPGANGEPSRKLGEHGLNLWRSVQAEFGIQDVGGLELLLQCCTALDRAEELRARIDADGAVVYARGVPKEHPAVKAELQCRAFICRTLARLGITDEPLKPLGRPPQGIGITHKDR
jgi:hypothetical protein